ncbi:hypothetical protein Tco_1150721, partial [Tanacetum coccineum]
MLANRIRENQWAHVSLDEEICKTGMSWLCAPTRAPCWFNLEWPHYKKHNMGKTVGELHAMLIEYEKGLPKKAETPRVMDLSSVLRILEFQFLRIMLFLVM